MSSNKKKLRIHVWDGGDVFNVRKTKVFGGTLIDSVEDMVNKTISKALENGGQGTIYRLNIHGHGASGIQEVGGGKQEIAGKHLDSRELANNTAARIALQKLRPYFSPDGMLVLHGCKVASGELGKKFMQELSSLVGVPVKAGTWYQFATPGIEFNTVRCTTEYCA